MTNPTDPAFPKEIETEDVYATPHTHRHICGLTKREYFASQCQAAILSGIYANPDHTNLLKRSMDDIGSEAMKHADTLIKELSKP